MQNSNEEHGHHHPLNVKKVDRLSPTRVRLHLEFPQDTVVQHEKMTVQKYMNLAKIPGFRPGKAPRNMVMNMYKDQIHQDLVSHLLEAGLHTALEQTKLYPVNQPKIEMKKGFKASEAFEFEAEFEVEPEIELRKYKNIPIKREAVVVTDEEVQKTIDGLRERFASLEPTEEKKATKGHFAVLEVEYTVHEEPPKVEPMQTITAEVGMGKLLPELDEALMKMSVGEKTEIKAAYPKDYGDTKLGGKDATFKMHLMELKKKVLPELNDAFAAGLRANATVEDLKKDIRANIESGKDQERVQGEHDAIVKYLVDNNPFEVPSSMVDRQTAHLYQRVEKDFRSRNLPMENLKEEDFKNLRKRAEQMVRTSLLLREVASKEKLKLDPERVEARVKAIAEQAKRSVEETAKYLQGKGMMQDLQEEIMTDQIFDFLLQNAEIKG